MITLAQKLIDLNNQGKKSEARKLANEFLKNSKK